MEFQKFAEAVQRQPVASLAQQTSPVAAKKFDDGKPAIEEGVFDYWPDALLEVAKVSMYGSDKYNVPLSDKNWARVPAGKKRYKNARGRHILYEAIEGVWDKEAMDRGHKIRHAAQVAWNGLAYLQLQIEEERRAESIKVEIEDIGGGGCGDNCARYSGCDSSNCGDFA